jgi:hypothetical protein
MTRFDEDIADLFPEEDGVVGKEDGFRPSCSHV